MKPKIIFEPNEQGGYTVIVSSLPDCISEGETKEEALKSIREAIELHLEYACGGQILISGTGTGGISAHRSAASPLGA